MIKKIKMFGVFLSLLAISLLFYGIHSHGTEDKINEYTLLMQKVNDAFNNHDSIELMKYMTNDVIFSQSTSKNPSNELIIEGSDKVKQAFDNTFLNFPDAKWVPRGPDAVFITGSDYRGISEWTFVGTRKSDNAHFLVDGVDLFTFKDGKIYTKDAFRKDVPFTIPSLTEDL